MKQPSHWSAYLIAGAITLMAAMLWQNYTAVNELRERMVKSEDMRRAEDRLTARIDKVDEQIGALRDRVTRIETKARIGPQ